MEIYRFLILIGLEIKKSIKSLPKLLIGSLILAAIVVGMVVGANSILGSDQKTEISSTNKIQIGIVSYDDSSLMDIAKGFITSAKSVKDTVNLIFLDEAEGRERLKKNQIIALIIIPDNVIKDIMSGKNTPVQVEFAPNAGYEAAVFKEIADGAVNILASSQAGIYSVYDFYNENHREFYIDSALERLNTRYIKAVLLREGLFENEQVVATGELDIIEYYAVSGIVLFMFLFGMNSISYMERYKRELIIGLKNSGIGILRQVISRFIGSGIIYIIIAGVAAMAMGWGIKGWLIMAPVGLVAGAFVILIHSLIHNKSAAIMTIFFAGIIQGFVTGGFIPEAMLPEAVSNMAKFTPAHYMINQLKWFYVGGSHIVSNTIILLGIAAIMVIVSAVCINIGGGGRKQ